MDSNISLIVVFKIKNNDLVDLENMKAGEREDMETIPSQSQKLHHATQTVN